MFYFKSFQFLCMHMFMGLVDRIVNGMVASSSSVGGSGTLHNLRSSCNQFLIFGRSNDPHLDKIVMLMSEIFNGSNVAVLHISIVLNLSLRQPLCIISCI